MYEIIIEYTQFTIMLNIELNSLSLFKFLKIFSLSFLLEWNFFMKNITLEEFYKEINNTNLSAILIKTNKRRKYDFM